MTSEPVPEPGHEALVAEWEQILEREGMPAEPKRKLRRGTQTRYGANRPWLGPYEFPAASVGNGHTGVDLDPSVGRTVYVDGAERPATIYEALMVAPFMPIDVATEELQPLRETLMGFVDKLPRKQRLIIELTILGDYTLSQAAKRLRMRRSTVWSMRNRTLRELRETLQDHRDIQAYLARHTEIDE